MDLFIFAYVLFCVGFGFSVENKDGISLSGFITSIMLSLFCPLILGEMIYKYLKSNTKLQ